MRGQKKAIGSRSLSVITVLYLLYLIEKLGAQGSPKTLCEYLHVSYPTLHRHIRLLREAYGVDIRTKRQTDNSTHFFIHDWGLFNRGKFIETFETTLLDLIRTNLNQNP